jgi:hypothetical protein
MLTIDGDRRVAELVGSINFRPGAHWAEESAGTNGPGTALASRKPVEVFASEHFVAALQPWSCAAAPVLGPTTRCSWSASRRRSPPRPAWTRSPHAVEAYVSIATTPITDACAIKAIELIAEYLRPAVANGANLDARDKMAYAEYLAGMAFNNASLGYVHAMAHQLGGFYNLPHGVCNAILLPAVCEFNLIAAAKRLGDVAVALGENIDGLAPVDAAAKGIAAIRKLSKSIDIPAGLKELGVKEADLPTMAENAKKDACQLTNPRTATLQQVVEIFKAAM